MSQNSSFSSSSRQSESPPPTNPETSPSGVLSPTAEEEVIVLQESNRFQSQSYKDSNSRSAFTSNPTQWRSENQETGAIQTTYRQTVRQLSEQQGTLKNQENIMMKKNNVGPLQSKKTKSVTDMFRAANEVSRTSASKFKGYANGCDVKAIINSMKADQKEHAYAEMTEAYSKYRRVVAEWMMDVCHYFNLHPTTTHAAVAYLDRLQPNEKFTRHEWQMLAIACILISSKYNESEEDVPELRVLEEITQQPISSEDVLNYELLALKRMGWKLNARTPVAFITSFCFAGVIHGFDSWDAVMTMSEMQARLYAECVSLATLCLLDDSFKALQASDVASAIIYYSRAKLGISPGWRKELSEASLCNPYTPDAIAAFRKLKEMFPQDVHVNLVMPGMVTPAKQQASSSSSPSFCSPSPVMMMRSSKSSPTLPGKSPSKSPVPVVSSAGSADSSPELHYKTPIAVRVLNPVEDTPTLTDLLTLQTPADQVVATTSQGVKMMGGKVLNMEAAADGNGGTEPSPVSIASFENC